jgi:hypothetical protein
MSSTQHYFEENVQEAFWKAMTPDVRGFLDALEKKETWTYTINEFGNLFSILANALPDIVQLPLAKEHQSVVHKLIPVLLAMPLRQCLSAVAYLDRYGSTEKNPVGWGVVCYLEASEAQKDSETTDLDRIYFKTFCDRVRVFISSTISVELFLYLNKEVIESV